MDFEAAARRDVEETLKVERKELELGVARGRLGLFVSLAVFGGVVAVVPVWTGLGHVDSWRRFMPFCTFSTGALYAFLVWRTARRGRVPRGFVSGVAIGDILVVIASVLFLRRMMAPIDPPIGGRDPLAARFDIYGLAPILLVALYLGTMRVAKGRRAALTVFAVAAYLIAIRVDLGRSEPPQGLAAMLILLGGVLGAKTSDRIGEMLDRHSRLSILRSYLPEAFTERVSSDSIDLSAALEPQSVEVTILVSDIRNFTAMSEQLAPADVVDMLGDYHAEMLTAIEANGGVIDKFLGDGILVIFGMPKPGAAPAADAGAAAAIQCAIAMLERLAAVNAARASAGRAALAIGVGIHTGPVVAGTIGAGRRREFTVIGDAVNTASRLEGLTKEAGAAILVSAATAARLAPDAAAGLRELPPMTVKGKSEPLRIFAVAAAAAAATGSPAAHRES